jgi:hypothetical protein
MSRSMSRITRVTGAALVIGAIAAPAAPAISPDAVDGWPAAEETAASKVSPDTADMARGHRIGATPVPEIVTVPVEVEVPMSNGVDPSDVAIGAGATMGLMLIAAGGALTVARRRRPAGIA